MKFPQSYNKRKGEDEDNAKNKIPDCGNFILIFRS